MIRVADSSGRLRILVASTMPSVSAACAHRAAPMGVGAPGPRHPIVTPSPLTPSPTATGSICQPRSHSSEDSAIGGVAFVDDEHRQVIERDRRQGGGDERVHCARRAVAARTGR